MTDSDTASRDVAARRPRDRWRWPHDLPDLLTGWPFGADERGEVHPIRVEEFQDGDELVVRAEVPGVDPEHDIDVRLENQVLTITARREEKKEEKSDGGYHSEFRYGGFTRTLRLPAGTKADAVSATYRDGVLEIRVPRPSPGSEPQRITVKRD